VLLIRHQLRTLEGYTRRARGVKALAFAILCLTVLVACGTAHAQDEEEAPPPYLNKIIIHGNEDVKTSDVRARMRTREPSLFAILRRPRLDRNQIDRDVAQIQAYYHSIGYPEATATVERLELLENGRFVNVHIRVVEGEPIRVRSVAFTGILILDESKLREGLLLQPGAPYNASLLATDIYKIKGRYFDGGYFGVLVDDSVRTLDHEVDIVFTIDPGPSLSVRNVSIEGNEAVRLGVVEDEVTFKSGEVCRYGKLVETQRNLFETGLFTQVEVIPENLDPVNRTVDVRIKVRERRQSWIEVGFGVGNILGSRIFTEWGTRNLAGTGRTVRLKAQYAFDLFEGDDIDFDRFDPSTTFYRYDAVYQQRRVFGIKLGFGVNAYIEDDRTVDEIEVKTIGTAVGVTHDFTLTTEGTLTFAIEDIRRREFANPEERTQTHMLTASVSKDTRDFILNPRFGQYRYVTTDVAGGILGGKNDFYGATFNYQRYHQAGASTFAWRFRTGFEEEYGRSSEVPVENRLFLGGSNSVRGYQESGLGPVEDDGSVLRARGGQVMLLANVELRFPVLSRKNFGGAVFVDAGNVWESASDIDIDQFDFISKREETTFLDFRYGVGLGLRYNTPIGPIRLDYGVPLKPDVNTDRNGTLYFSLGQIF